MRRSVYANGGSECLEYPADECYGNDSDWCRQQEEARVAHNAGEDRRQQVMIAVGLILLGTAAVLAGVVAAYN